MCGRAKTGSGKTLAFGVPMLARITDTAEPRRPLGLVLVPTRELAVQVAEVLEPIAGHAGQRVLAVYGGASRHTPDRGAGQGRRAGRRHAAAPDRPASSRRGRAGRHPDRRASTRPTGWPTTASRRRSSGSCGTAPNRNQTMLFSATLDGDVGHLIRHYLNDPVEVAVDEATDTVGTMHHLFLAVHHMDKDKVIGAIGQGIPKIVVFCQTKRNCDRVARNLDDLGVSAAAIHGDLPQKARERALQRFAEGKLARAGGDRRGRPWHRHRRHRRGDPLRARQGRQGLPAPLGSHGPRRAGRLGGHARRVQPAHPDADPAARHATAVTTRRSRCSRTTRTCAISPSFGADVTT